MGELLAQDGHRRADALEHGGREGGADGQPVDEVVQAVAQRDHPGQRADVGVGRPLQPIASPPFAAGACDCARLGPRGSLPTRQGREETL